MMTTCKILILVCFLVAVLASEQQLLNNLLKNYDVRSRPINNGTDNDAVKVNVSFGIVQLQEIDQAAQTLTLVGWQALEWTDPRLTWDPAETNTQNTVLKTTDVWQPDIQLLNGIQPPQPLHDTHLFISPDGRVSWSNLFKFNVFCETSPDDNQPTCKMDFAPWTYSSDMVDLSPKFKFVNAQYYVANLDWELSKSKVVRVVRDFPWNPLRQCTQVSYTFTLIRREPLVDEDDKNKENGSPRFCVSSATMALSLMLFSLSR